jgi:hypothetical protein
VAEISVSALFCVQSFTGTIHPNFYMGVAFIKFYDFLRPE